MPLKKCREIGIAEGFDPHPIFCYHLYMERTFENTEVRIIDYKKIESELEPVAGKVRFMGFGGFISNPSPAIVDRDIIVNFPEDDGKFEFVMHKVTESGGVNLLPHAAIRLTPEELEQYLGETTTLAEFTKDRRGYNSRLKSNEAEVQEWLNE